MTIATKTLAAAVALGWAATAVAAPIGVVSGDPRIDLAPVGPTLTYLEDGAGGADLVLDPLTFGFDEGGEDYYLDLFMTYGLDDPSGTASGSLSVHDEADGSGFLFGGFLSDYGTVSGDIVQFLFDDDGSTTAPLAGQLLVELAFAQDLPGDDPLRNLSDGARYEIVGAVEVVAPIPLPASLPLLLGAGAAMAAARRFRKTARA